MEWNIVESTLKKLIIQHADLSDLVWLKKNDRHVSAAVLKSKIVSREVYVIREEGKIAGWLRYSLFWDEYPFINMLYLLDGYRGRGIGSVFLPPLENW
jgi:GNAT superfamily N-acetyltransferase